MKARGWGASHFDDGFMAENAQRRKEEVGENIRSILERGSSKMFLFSRRPFATFLPSEYRGVPCLAEHDFSILVYSLNFHTAFSFLQKKEIHFSYS